MNATAKAMRFHRLKAFGVPLLYIESISMLKKKHFWITRLFCSRFEALHKNVRF